MLEPTAPRRKAPLDTRHQVETPEGIDLPLRPAGLMVRAVAFAIDLGIRGLILGVLFIALAFLGKLGMGLGSLLLFAISWVCAWYTMTARRSVGRPRYCATCCALSIYCPSAISSVRSVACNTRPSNASATLPPARWWFTANGR